MDFRFTAEQEAFRQEIHAFVREALPEPLTFLKMPGSLVLIGRFLKN